MTAAAATASAAVLYDNGGVNGTSGAFDITDYPVMDSFVLSTAATITGVNFGVWTNPGEAVLSVDWGITSFVGDYVDNGPATVISGVTSLNPDGYAVGMDSFATGPVTLAAGVYYLVLQNAQVSNGDVAYWDESDGLSSAFSQILGSLVNANHPNTTGSESFQILGTSDGGDGVPEPAAWLLMLVGVAGLGATLRAARQTPSAIRSR